MGSMNRTLLAVSLLSLAACGTTEAPPEPTPDGATMNEVRAAWGDPCTTSTDGNVWGFCLNACETGGARVWCLTSCYAACPELTVTFSQGRKVSAEYPPGP